MRNTRVVVNSRETARRRQFQDAHVPWMTGTQEHRQLDRVNDECADEHEANVPPAYHPNPTVLFPFSSVSNSKSTSLSPFNGGLTNLANSGVLYGCPFAVWENMK